LEKRFQNSKFSGKFDLAFGREFESFYRCGDWKNRLYVRQRDLEFSTEFEARGDLIKRIDETINLVDLSLSTLTVEDLEKEYPRYDFGHPITFEFFLVHLAMHLSYHLGQINYHRRLLDEN
jgi:hypothetical protein